MAHVIHLIHLATSNTYALLWKQMPTSLYQILRKSCDLDSTEDDQQLQARKGATHVDRKGNHTSYFSVMMHHQSYSMPAFSFICCVLIPLFPHVGVPFPFGHISEGLLPHDAKQRGYFLLHTCFLWDGGSAAPSK